MGILQSIYENPINNFSKIGKILLKTLCSLLLLFATLCFSGCSSNEKSSDTAEGSYAIAEDYEKNERFEEAIKRYTEVKNKFPYSSYATKAELAIADVHFKDEAFAEAQLNYQTFKELHPKHAQIDYVIFRIGLSYYMQLPDSIDRDLTFAVDAINNFDELIRSYPTSQYLKEAKDKREDCEKKLALKEEYIADFYYKKEVFLSAFGRYDGIFHKYLHHTSELKIAYRSAISAHKANKPGAAAEYLRILREKYQNTAEYQEARKVIE